MVLGNHCGRVIWPPQGSRPTGWELQFRTLSTAPESEFAKNPMSSAILSPTVFQILSQFMSPVPGSARSLCLSHTVHLSLSSCLPAPSSHSAGQQPTCLQTPPTSVPLAAQCLSPVSPLVTRIAALQVPAQLGPVFRDVTLVAWNLPQEKCFHQRYWQIGTIFHG